MPQERVTFYRLKETERKETTTERKNEESGRSTFVWLVDTWEKWKVARLWTFGRKVERRRPATPRSFHTFSSFRISPRIAELRLRLHRSHVLFSYFVAMSIQRYSTEIITFDRLPVPLTYRCCPLTKLKSKNSNGESHTAYDRFLATGSSYNFKAVENR